MPFQVIPREQSFFDLFEEQAEVVVQGARELKELTESFGSKVRSAAS